MGPQEKYGADGWRVALAVEQRHEKRRTDSEKLRGKRAAEGPHSS
jgi:hypothetical protein